MAGHDGEAAERAADPGDVRTQISNGLVALLREYYGRGPERTRTYVGDDLVVCVLRGGFTRVEQTLLESGRGGDVIRQRMVFQDVMRERFEAVVEKATGRWVGRIGLNMLADWPGPDKWEVGYELAPEFWGRGLATEGSRALVDLAFTELGAGRVHAETMVVHEASRRVMEKAGLRLVRTFHAEWPVRIPGDEQGDVEYAITREEWEAERRERLDLELREPREAP